MQRVVCLSGAKSQDVFRSSRPCDRVANRRVWTANLPVLHHMRLYGLRRKRRRERSDVARHSVHHFSGTAPSPPLALCMRIARKQAIAYIHVINM